MRRLSSLALLNLVQFFAAINENLYKLLAAYFLIHELGQENTDTIMATVGAIFILPFLLFSSVGGVLADIFPKNRITIATRFLELLCLIFALFLFGWHISHGAYVILFLMTTLSALFGPSKYGMIPELVSRANILYANSIIATYTFLGIIIGTTLASFLIFITSADYTLSLLVSIAFALLGSVLSFFLPQTEVANESKPLRWFVYGELWDALKQMYNIPSLFAVTTAYAYFLFVGAFIQLNIIPYTMEMLGFSDIIGGYLFLLTAFGLGLGAFFTNRLSKGTIRLDMIPLSGIAISLLLACLKWFYTPWWLAILWMILLGFFGGTFLVPPQAYIVSFSPEKDRGRNFATANFFSFVFAPLASFALYLFNTLLDLSPATSFLAVGCLNLLVMLLLIWKTDWLRQKTI